MLKLYKILLFFLIIIAVDVKAQQPKIKHFTISEEFPEIAINSIVQDKIGYLWLATEKGLFRFDGNKFIPFKNQNSANPISLFSKDDNLYVSYKEGFFLFNNNSFQLLGKEIVNKTINIDSEIYLGTAQGIYQLKKDYLQPLQLHTKIDFSPIIDIILLKEDIYIATKTSLWVVDELLKPKKIIKILDDEIVGLLINDNQIIAATKNNGLKVIYKNKLIETIPTEQRITSSKLINNEIWIASLENGIEIYNAKTYRFIRKINKYNSEIPNQIQTLFKDQQNNIWIATKNKGLYRYSSSEELSIKKPIIAFENISINYKKVPFSKDLKLSNNENNISFSFKTVDLNNSKSVQYRYQLNEKNTPWSFFNSVDFASLKPGNYVLSIQSKINNTISNKETVKFYIDTPIYKKPWFLILLFSITSFLVAILVDFRIKNIQKKNKKLVEKLKLENHLLSLEQKALQLQMNPHFIFNVLNGIKALGNSGKTLELNETISHFSLLLRNMLESSRLEEISLKQEIETLHSYLSLEKLMNSKTFDYQIKISLSNIDPEEILIPPMLIQPFVENAIKHGIQPNTKNGKIMIHFLVNHDTLNCIIEDNGIGINGSKKRSHKSDGLSIAMKVTKDRIQNLSKNNSFTVKELKDENTIKGTMVSFKIPLKTDF